MLCVGLVLYLCSISLSCDLFMQYEPELFPGLIYRMKQPKIVLLIFVSGKIVITGAKVNPKISCSSSVICILMEFGCWYFCLFDILGERGDIHSLWKYIPCPYRVQESPAMVYLSISVPCFISDHWTLIMLNLYVFSIGLQIHNWNGPLVLLWIVMDDVGPSVCICEAVTQPSWLRVCRCILMCLVSYPPNVGVSWGKVLL